MQCSSFTLDAVQHASLNWNDAEESWKICSSRLTGFKTETTATATGDANRFKLTSCVLIVAYIQPYQLLSHWYLCLFFSDNIFGAIYVFRLLPVTVNPLRITPPRHLWWCDPTPLKIHPPPKCDPTPPTPPEVWRDSGALQHKLGVIPSDSVIKISSEISLQTFDHRQCRVYDNIYIINRLLSTFTFTLVWRPSWGQTFNDINGGHNMKWCIKVVPGYNVIGNWRAHKTVFPTCQ